MSRHCIRDPCDRIVNAPSSRLEKAAPCAVLMVMKIGARKVHVRRFAQEVELAALDKQKWFFHTTRSCQRGTFSKAQGKTARSSLLVMFVL
jgi:hypothetical protein